MSINEAALAPQVYEQMQQAMAHDPAGFAELYRDYLADAWQALQMLRNAVQQHDANEVRTKAHQLKGSSLVLGARLVAQWASALEEMGRNADLRSAGEMLDRTRRALQDVQAELTGRLGAAVVPANVTAAF